MYRISSKVNDDSEKLLYCRTCAQKKKDLIPIFREEGKDRQLADKISNCLPILVVEDDWLPLQVCRRCALWLDTAQELHTSCLSADDKLRRIFTEPPNYNNPLQSSFNNNFHDSLSHITSDEEPLHVNPNISDPLTTIGSDVEVSGALQFLASELGVKDAKTLLIVDKIPPECDDAPIAMPIQKDVIPPPLICDLCDFSPKGSRGFCNHSRLSHEREMHACHLCYVYFSTYYLLREHFALIHPYIIIRPNIINHSNISRKKPEKVKLKKNKVQRIATKKNRKCSKCGEVFPYEALDDFRKHIKIHRDERRSELMKTADVKCDYCDKLFLTNSSKIVHMKHAHVEYKPYKCEICNKTFHVKKYFNEHRLTHEADRPFLCNVCGKGYTGKLMLSAHMQNHMSWTCWICNAKVGKRAKEVHLGTHLDKRIYQCMECGQSFFDRKVLRDHSASHFVTVCQCDICGFCFNSEQNLSAHQEYHQDNLTHRYKCPVKLCFKQFITATDAAKHVSLHSKEEQFTIVRVGEQRNKCRSLYCDTCETSFRHMGMYLDHMSSHQCDPQTQNWLYCAVCKFRARDDTELTSHLECHPQAFDFPCRHCKKSFVTDKQREIHEGVTHAKKVYSQLVQCPHCFLMVSRQFLKSHINSVHTGERPYICEICGKGFFDLKTLSSHRSVHSGIKKFSCDICSKSFRLKQDLGKHYLVHAMGKLYKCSECSHSTNKKRDMNLHIAAEHADVCDQDSD